ncbi:MAG: ATP-binding protein [Mycobacteriales bacterium]
MRDWLPRPLDPLRSFKAKTSLLVGLSLLASGAAFALTSGLRLGWALLIALLVAVGVTQVLAHGMTSPLREMTAAARRMAGGDYDVSVRATSHDEVGELAVAFNQMSADLAAADRYRRELIGNVSHELRTPISALHALLENVADGIAPADDQTLRTALEQTDRLGRLVAELLDLSRLDAGALTLRREQFDVGAFLSNAVSQCSSPARVAIDVRPAGLRAVADVARLNQVVSNLVENALRHSPSGDVVRVEARAAGTGLQLDVVDSGPGIPVSERARVFERFTRGGSSTADGGTGLGLAIARWAVELHGGGIAVVGDRPGCRIRVSLPS